MKCGKFKRTGTACTACALVSSATKAPLSCCRTVLWCVLSTRRGSALRSEAPVGSGAGCGARGSFHGPCTSGCQWQTAAWFGVCFRSMYSCTVLFCVKILRQCETGSCQTPAGVLGRVPRPGLCHLLSLGLLSPNQGSVTRCAGPWHQQPLVPASPPWCLQCLQSL